MSPRRRELGVAAEAAHLGGQQTVDDEQILRVPDLRLRGGSGQREHRAEGGDPQEDSGHSGELRGATHGVLRASGFS